MQKSLLSWADTKPELLPRECGGWLAIAPEGSAFQIAVVAQTEKQAIDKFEQSKERWAEILLSEAR